MSTMCIDIRRVNDDYVCIYQAEHNHFSWPTHLPQSSWNGVDPKDEDNNYFYNYFLVAKNYYYGDIEMILYSSRDRNHTYKILKECKKGKKSALFYFDTCHDYRVIRVPIYRYVPFRVKLEDGNVYNGRRQVINKLKDEYRLYCPKDLNKKYKVYGTFGDRKKNGKERYWTSPRKLGERK